MNLFLIEFSILLCLLFNNSMTAIPPKFGNYEVVQPRNVSQSKPKSVPVEILRPAYVYQKAEEEPPHILIKNQQEIESIRKSCRLAKSLIDYLRKSIRIGMTTNKLDSLAHNFIITHGAYPSPLGYENFPKSICTSVNNIVVHGIPDSRRLKNGDIISVDVTVYLNGYHGDTAETFLVGNVDEAGRKLVQGTQEILNAGIRCCRPNVTFEKLAQELCKAAKERGLVIIPAVIGHGIGRYFHELPYVWHEWPENLTNIYEEADKTLVMLPGMVFTIEPAVGEGSNETLLYDDEWSMTTADDSRAAHFEHTIAITDTGYDILTK